jgi:hypothetical protein
MTHILYAANEHGYSVLVMNGGSIESRHDFGNHVKESTTFVDPTSDNALPVETIHKFAKSTADQMAKDLAKKLRKTILVEYDDDLEESIAADFRAEG